MKQRKVSKEVHIEPKQDESSAEAYASEDAFEEIETSEIEEAQERELIENNSYFKYLYERIKELENMKSKSADSKVDTQLNHKVKQCNLWQNNFSDTKKEVYVRMLDRLNSLFREIYNHEI